MLIVANSIILFYYLNWIGLLSPVLIISLIMIQRKMNNRFYKFVKQKMNLAEKRAKKIDEFVSGIKLIKFRAWEELIYSKIDEIRKDETSLTFKIFTCFGISYLLVTLIPMFCAILSIYLYGIIYGKLDIAQIFALLALFTNIIHPIKLWIWTLFNFMEAKASCKRIDNYCMLPQREEYLQS